MRALVHLDTGNDAFFLQVFRERLVAGDGALANGLVEQDHPAHELLDPLGGEQQVAIGAAVGFRTFGADRLEALLAGAAGFVGGQQPFALGDHGSGSLGKQVLVHGVMTSS